MRELLLLTLLLPLVANAQIRYHFGGDPRYRVERNQAVFTVLALVILATLQPAEILAAMNRVLGEGSGGFVTAIAIRFRASGNLTLANAVHLLPYRGGVELTVEPGLPPGILRGAENVETHLHISAGDSLTLLTDGVVEAENAKRELFGFERTREFSGKSALEIAKAAEAWGQNDDITVVTVRRNG